jgi:hypothetical protein
MSDDPFKTAADEAQAEAVPTAEAPAESVFDTPPADAPKKAPAKKAAPKKAAVTDEDDEDDYHPFTVSMKPHAGHNAPLFVFRGKSVTGLADLFSPDHGADMVRLFESSARAAVKLTEVYEKAGHTAAAAPSAYGNKSSGGSGGGSSAASKPPQEATEPPNGEYKYCKHGQMKFKSFVSKAGKFTQLFECTEEDEDSKCKTEFLKDKK